LAFVTAPHDVEHGAPAAAAAAAAGSSAGQSLLDPVL